VKQCRNPKLESQRLNKIAALEDELASLAVRHAAMIERFIKIQQGEKDPDGAQAKRDAAAKRLAERKTKYARVIAEKHRIVDSAVREKRDAFLWGGVPHMSAASLNNSTMSKAASVGERVRRISRFGFRSDDDDLSSSSAASAEPVIDSPKKVKRGCLPFRCCR
jgi:hypothetical protein